MKSEIKCENCSRMKVVDFSYKSYYCELVKMIILS